MITSIITLGKAWRQRCYKKVDNMSILASFNQFHPHLSDQLI
jgi:hypothetical protein